MKKIFSFFKNKIVIAVIGLIVIALIVWFIGPSIKIGDNNYTPLGSELARLVLIFVIVALWLVSKLREVFNNRKKNEDLVTDIQGNQNSNRSTEQSNSEVTQIEHRFSEALSTLKRLKFTGKGAQKALYELPWYIIIGPPGSGKTTALVKSSLDFPLAEKFGDGALQGVGGTRNCDWWFTNEAVLIDTAGRYTTQDSHRVVDSSAWEGFLNLLKKNRRRRPINGAIVAISIFDLLVQSEDERQQHAKIIRSRLDELMDKLEIRFPIYLMFTKTDQIPGFSEYFEDLGKDDREQVWGVTLPNSNNISDEPDFNFLKNGLNDLIKRLYDRVLWRVQQETDIERRSKIQNFPQQMENLRHIVESFIQQTFIRNRFHFQPYLRGFYFTSGVQDGSSIDRLMTSISSKFGFVRDTTKNSFLQGKSFFLGQLFKSVIIPESELVGINKRYELVFRWLQNGSYVAIASLGLLLFSIWLGSITRHEMFMSKIAGYVSDFRVESKSRYTRDKDLRSVLSRLNILGKASIVYDQEQHPWLSGLGLYDGNIDSAADKAYAEQLKILLLPRLLMQLEYFLKNRRANNDVYSTFRTYLMFNKIEHLERDYIINWFKSDWDKRYRGQAIVRKQLLRHLSNLLNLDLQARKLNKQVVQQTRLFLSRIPVAKRVYSRIRSNPTYTQKVDILHHFGQAVRSSYKMSNSNNPVFNIPFLYTREAYKSIDFSVDSPLITEIDNERWVLTDARVANGNYVRDDLKAISKKLKTLYLVDYSNTWKRIFKALQISDFRNLNHASEVINRFTDSVYSPLLAILQVTQENTQLTPALVTDLVEKEKDGMISKFTSYFTSKAIGNKVDKDFNKINRLLRETSQQPAQIIEILQKLESIRDFIGEINLSPDASKSAFEIAKARYTSGAGNAITALRLYAKTSPKPIRRWLHSIADQSWKVLLQSAHSHINQQWKNQVYRPYSQALAGRYPLSLTSRNELAIIDFSEFFKKEGTMDVFFNYYIKPFLNTKNKWSNRVVDKFSVGLSSRVIYQIRKAHRIKNIFFREDPVVPSITFQLKPYRMGKGDARFTLEIGDNRIVYNHGPKFWKSVTWTGGDENTRARIIFEDLDQTRHSKYFDGNWAWFRLQDQAKLTKSKQKNIYYITYSVSDNVKNDHSIMYQMKAESINNPFNTNLLRSFRVSERI